MNGVSDPISFIIERFYAGMGFVTAFALAALAIIVVLTLVWPRGTLSRLKVRPRPLMTQAERRVCAMIEEALPGTRVHSQVSMGAIMQPAKNVSKSEWWSTFNRFSSKRVDFVVEDPATGAIIMLVELDDPSHQLSTDKDRDALTRRAGYITVRIPPGKRPTRESVATLLHDALGFDPRQPHRG
ncbi:DUF2726 domain-containing protein [Erythrobacter donghaensis]|uniref:DUF2726 domain-containing protein n=1 Tax=Erythrobacter donghaensis TaxID=267135 RepID=UPI000939206C|nr:DUF2726 domain-containing protein [Erythrobacter donghaensis]